MTFNDDHRPALRRDGACGGYTASSLSDRGLLQIASSNCCQAFVQLLHAPVPWLPVPIRKAQQPDRSSSDTKPLFSLRLPNLPVVVEAVITEHSILASAAQPLGLPNSQDSLDGHSPFQLRKLPHPSQARNRLETYDRGRSNNFLHGGYRSAKR